MAGQTNKTLRYLVFALLLVLLGFAFWLYRIVYVDNVDLANRRAEYFFIHTGWTYPDVLNGLVEGKFIRNRQSFEWVAKLKKYEKFVKPGRYHIQDNMSNSALINLLKKGDTDPVHFTFNLVHSKTQLASRVGGKLEVDSVDLLNKLNDDAFLSRYGFNSNNILGMFIPNTYSFPWTTTTTAFLDEMAKEYRKFWTEERKAKAKLMGLGQTEVITLASIVQEEQNRYDDEKPIIAGVYMNRLKTKMPLQSDPTVRFALGDYSLNRILSSDLKTESPYNTYHHTGLPPGPICFPDASSVDAVLNYKKHKFVYMCAEFGTGRHNFSETFEQHKVYAQRYREALDRNGIKR
jgi:UPF0755 protein